MKISLDFATAFGCPFEGKFKTETIVNFLKNYNEELGTNDIVLCDTIGVAVPNQVKEIINVLKAFYSKVNFQVHIHDTSNLGMVHTLAAIKRGITNVQSILGGLRGCPFAPDAPRNLATEYLVYMLNESNYSTGINFEKILDIAKYEKQTINGVFNAHKIGIKSNL